MSLLFDTEDAEEARAQHREVKRQDARREVTYDVFAHELWTRIKKKAKTNYHPSLVWMEIQSFIQVRTLSVSTHEVKLVRLQLETGKFSA